MIRLIILFLFCSVANGQVLIDSYRYAGCTPDPDEVHTNGNAASDPNCNEENDATGWSDVGAGTVVSSAGALAGGAGDYKLQFPASSGSGGEYMLYNFTATIGHSYQVTAVAQIISGTSSGTPGWKSWTGTTVSYQAVGTSEASLNVTVEATGTTVQIRLYPGNDATAIIACDNLSIIDLGDLTP